MTIKNTFTAASTRAASLIHCSRRCRCRTISSADARANPGMRPSIYQAIEAFRRAHALSS